MECEVIHIRDIDEISRNYHTAAWNKGNGRKTVETNKTKLKYLRSLTNYINFIFLRQERNEKRTQELREF